MVFHADYLVHRLCHQKKTSTTHSYVTLVSLFLLQEFIFKARPALRCPQFFFPLSGLAHKKLFSLRLPLGTKGTVSYRFRWLLEDSKRMDETSDFNVELLPDKKIEISAISVMKL